MPYRNVSWPPTQKNMTLGGLYTAETFLLFLVLIPVVSSFGVSKCYHCANAGSLSQCRYVQNCNRLNQLCLMEEYKGQDGIVHYFAGCVPTPNCPTDGQTKYSKLALTGQIMCSSCCSTDLCNTRFCGLSGTGVLPTAIPVKQETRCFHCGGVSVMEECTETSKCSQGERCYLELYETEDKKTIFYGGCASETSCKTSNLPVQKGKRLCGTCCGDSFCNYDLCNTQLKTYNSAQLTPAGTSLRRCYQCYDQKIDEIHLCFHTVQCASCSSVVRNDSGILTVDLDCEENLSCTSGEGTNGQICGICCNSDGCNREVDCRNSVVTSQPVTIPNVIPTGNHKGVDCEICSGGQCGLAPGQFPHVRCSDNTTPFCLNRVVNDANGDKHVLKRCGSVSECEVGLMQSSMTSQCMNFDPSSIYTTSFECTYCCVTPNCNRHIIPDSRTLYVGNM